jgi:DNA-binding MarR family transcriptional regulator
MDTNERILEELILIKKMLTILSQDKLSEFNDQIRGKFLTTEQREIMYDLFDGSMSLKEIAEKAGTSSEAVRLFAVSLEKAGLLEYVTNSKSKCPKRLL